MNFNHQMNSILYDVDEFQRALSLSGMTLIQLLKFGLLVCNYRDVKILFPWGRCRGGGLATISIDINLRQPLCCFSLI
jgi:hypothetical protein